MPQTVVARAGQYLLVLSVMLLLNFFLPRWIPGTPLQFLAGEDVGLLPAEVKQQILRQYGLDRPLWEQFIRYTGNLIRGDLGYSYQQRRPIGQIVAERLPWTLLLTGTSMVLSTVAGVLFGTWAAWHRGSRFDITLTALFVFLDSLPSFWLGMVLVALFAAKWNLFPIFGAFTPWQPSTGWARAVDILWHLVLPATTLTVVTIAGVYLVMRSAMLDVLGEDYIAVARAKGASIRRVVFRHALRNALLPVATVFMLSLGFLVSGATVVETVFSYPGLGRLMYEAVLTRDYPVLQAAFLMVTVSVLVSNFAADLVYPILDPRVRGAIRGR